MCELAPIVERSSEAIADLPDGIYDNWLAAVAPWPDPNVVVTAVVQGPGTGSNNAKDVVSGGLRYYMDHREELLATGPMQGPVG